MGKKDLHQIPSLPPIHIPWFATCPLPFASRNRNCSIDYTLYTLPPRTRTVVLMRWNPGGLIRQSKVGKNESIDSNFRVAPKSESVDSSRFKLGLAFLTVNSSDTVRQRVLNLYESSCPLVC